MAWITRHKRTTYDWHEVPDRAVPSDREMKAALVSRLNENLYTQDYDIRVEVDHRVVVLHGDVDSPIVKRVAGDDAWDVPGVVEVENQLTIAA
jgi:osmotically-inducible protein OsmY